MMAQSKPKQKKKLSPKQKLYWIGGVCVFLGLLVMLFMPRQGTIQYGICNVFLELSEFYPEQLKPLSVDDYVPIGGPVKITYKRVDPFGVDSVNTIECVFKKDELGKPTTELLKVDINGKARIYGAEDPQYIKKFNLGIPSILGNPPSLTLPSFSLDKLVDYKDSE